MDITRIEEFFGAKFEVLESIEPGQPVYRELYHFDGHAHWTVMLEEARNHLFFTAGEGPRGMPHSVELSVYYSSSKVHAPISSGLADVILICPKGCTTGANLVGLEKRMEGRICISTTAGEVPQDSRDTLVEKYFGSSLD